ncbi:MAG: hypothetical protein U1E75_12680 [Alicycliphilus sp.]
MAELLVAAKVDPQGLYYLFIFGSTCEYPLPTLACTSAQAAFSGLDVATRQRELERCVADLPGGFTTKTVKGRTYWYYQLKNPAGSVTQIYLGPDEPPIREVDRCAWRRPASRRGAGHQKHGTGRY